MKISPNETMLVTMKDWDTLKGNATDVHLNGSLRFNKGPADGGSVPPSWRDTRCGHDIELGREGHEGWFNIVESEEYTGERVHGTWLDWKSVRNDEDSVPASEVGVSEWYDDWEVRLHGRENVTN